MITSLLFNPGTESQIKGDIETHSNLAERGNLVSDRKNHVVWWVLKSQAKNVSNFSQTEIVLVLSYLFNDSS